VDNLGRPTKESSPSGHLSYTVYKDTAYEVRILPPNRVRIQGKLVGLFRRY